MDEYAPTIVVRQLVAFKPGCLDQMLSQLKSPETVPRNLIHTYFRGRYLHRKKGKPQRQHPLPQRELYTEATFHRCYPVANDIVEQTSPGGKLEFTMSFTGDLTCAKT